jgi:thioredoxin 1
MNRIISSEDELADLLNAQPMVLVYLSHDGCQVCKVLKPKVEEMVEREFPLMVMAEVNTFHSADLAAQLSVFAVPTILLYADGNEMQRFSRTFGIVELGAAIQRPYAMIYE